MGDGEGDSEGIVSAQGQQVIHSTCFHQRPTPQLWQSPSRQSGERRVQSVVSCGRKTTSKVTAGESM